MSKSIFSRPVSKESHNRNGFDRSQVQNVNLSAGMLIPTFCEFVFGHSHARINQRSFMRTATVNKPAFPSLPMYTDYFFVPMHQLLSSYNAFRSQTNDRYSTNIAIMKSMPYFDNSILQNTITAYKDTYDLVGCFFQDGAMRLLDMLRYGYNITHFQHTNQNYNKWYDYGNLNPLKLAAYQKIYYDHYRNTAYEANDVEAYNLDKWVNSSGVGLALNTGQMYKLLSLRYANYKKDLVNTVYPSLNFIASSANPLLISNGSVPLPSSVVGVGSVSGSSGVAYSPQVNGLRISPSADTTTTSGQVQFGFSLQNIRAALAYEKLVRVSSFAPQHVVDQFEARFGYRPKSDSLNESVRLGSFMNNIIIGEVTSTTENNYASLGAVGGKGVGSADFDKVISYDVPEDGFIMGITYVAPPCTYDSDAIDPINQQFLPEDWSLPEYENLGLQPLFLKNVSAGQSAGEDTEEVTSAVHLQRINKILGYQPRDMQYKANISLNHGLFNTNGLLSSFVLHGRKSWFENAKDDANNGVDASYFKIDPADLNPIFANYQILGNETDDHFFGNIVNSFAIVQDKPVFGFSFNL